MKGGNDMKKMFLQGIAAAMLCLFLCSCFTPQNNYLKPEDFAARLEAEGIKVTAVRSIPGEPFLADAGAAIMVDGSEIGVYKYNRDVRVQRKRIERRKESGRTYINGIPFPVEVYGSFMFMGLEKNKKKHEILKAIKKFR